MTNHTIQFDTVGGPKKMDRAHRIRVYSAPTDGPAAELYINKQNQSPQSYVYKKIWGLKVHMIDEHHPTTPQEIRSAEDFSY